MEISFIKNDIEYLRKNFAIISDELVTLKGFVQQQFGSKYEDYCISRGKQPQLKQELTLTLPIQREEFPIPIPSTSRRPVTRSFEYDSHDRDTEGQTTQILDNSMEEYYEVVDNSGNDNDTEDSDRDFDPLTLGGEGSEDEDASVEHKTSLKKVKESGGTKCKMGRKRNFVYRFFETDEDPTKLKCPNCLNQVSSRAQRLKTHLLKCRANDPEIISVRKHLTNGPSPSRRQKDDLHLSFADVKDSMGFFISKKCRACGKVVGCKRSKMKLHLESCSQQKKTRPTTATAAPNNASQSPVNDESYQTSCSSSTSTSMLTSVEKTSVQLQNYFIEPDPFPTTASNDIKL